MLRSFRVSSPDRLALLLVLTVALTGGCGGGSGSSISNNSVSSNGSGTGSSGQTGGAGSGDSGQTSGSGTGSSGQTGGSNSSGGSGAGGSNPGGGSWTQLPDPFNNNRQTRMTAMALAANGNLYVGGSTGVAVSTDGGQTWNVINTGLTGLKVHALGFNSLGDPIACMGESTDIGLFRYVGGSWHQATGITANHQISAITQDSTGALVAVTAWAGDVYRSTDNGDTFTKVASTVGSSTPGITVGALWTVFKANDGSLYTAGEVQAGVYRSTDNGSTWQQDGLSKAQGYAGNIYVLGTNAQGEILAGRANSAGAPLQRRTSTGWVNASTGLPVYYGVQGLALTPAHAVLVSVTSPTTGGIYRSADNGQTWTNYSTGLPNNAVGALVVDKAGAAYVTVLPSNTTGPFGIYKRNAP